MRLLRPLCGLLLLLTAAGSVRAEPAIWVARSATATVYLFGTVHLLKGHVDWRSPRIDHALAESQDLWLEVQNPTDTAAIAPLITQYAIDAAHPLSTRLNEAERARLATIVTRAGLPGIASLEPFHPWMVALLISMSPVAKAGYDPNSGVEKILTTEMKDTGRPVYGLETVEQQLKYFTTMSPPAEVQMLDETMDDVDGEVARIDAVVAAWMAGDVDTIARLMNEDVALKEPDAYRALIVDRNVAWARRLADRLKGTGVSFVAVGAGHLVGPDSVQTQLAKLGFTVEREGTGR